MLRDATICGMIDITDWSVIMMSNVQKIEAIKAEISEISKRITEKTYVTLEEKHELQKKRWLLKRTLSAIENGSDCGYLDLFRV